YPIQGLRRLDRSIALIDVRCIEPKDRWPGVPIRMANLFPNPSDWTGVFGVHLFRYRGIWICSCWMPGKPGHHKHPLFGDDWPEWVTLWEVTPEQAFDWFSLNHQPIPDELRPGTIDGGSRPVAASASGMAERGQQERPKEEGDHILPPLIGN